MASNEELETAYQQGNGVSHIDGLKAVFEMGVEAGRKAANEEHAKLDDAVNRGYLKVEPEEEQPRRGRKAR